MIVFLTQIFRWQSFVGYGNDTRVWCISGSIFKMANTSDSSYYFSRYNHHWGWASWRRAWRHYDSSLSQWPVLRDSCLLETIFENRLERIYWSNIWERLYLENKPDSWAYRWSFTCLSNGGLTVLPNPIVENVGFGDSASHTVDFAYSTKTNLGLEALKHPDFLIRNSEADRFTFANIFSPPKPHLIRRIYFRIKYFIRNLIV